MKKPESNGTSQKNGERKTIKNLTFEVKRVHMFDNGGVVADLCLNEIDIYGVRVVEGKNGDFLSFPQRKGADGKYYSICYASLCEADTKAILSEIERKLNGGQ